ncbi:hypothetical protein FBALC1_11622 [Flavobacteriales bacterium ALC-1]|nr:hypothetical protein FBALC1_11622 [Flavobacteriales bacterium ALC-1]
MIVATKYNNANKKIYCLAASLLLTIGANFSHHPVIAFLFILIAFISIFKVTKGRLLMVRVLFYGLLLLVCNISF